MSLMSNKSGIHNHLASSARRKHSTLHTVTTGKHAEQSAKPVSPFGQLKYEPVDEKAPPVYKSIFSL